MYAIVADVIIFDQAFVPQEILGAAIITFFNLFTICYKMRHGGTSESDGVTVDQESEDVETKTATSYQ